MSRVSAESLKKVFAVWYGYTVGDEKYCLPISQILDVKFLTPIEKLIFIDLVLAKGEDRRHEVIQQIFGVSKTTVSQAIRHLKKLGIIKRREQATKHDESSITSYEILN